MGSAPPLCSIHTASSLTRKRKLILGLFSTSQNQVKHLSALSQAIKVLDVLWEAAVIFFFLPSAAVWMLVSLLYVGGDQCAALQNPCASHLHFPWTLRCNLVGNECSHFPGCQTVIRPLLAVKVIQWPMVRPIEDQEGRPLSPKVLKPGLLSLGSWVTAALLLLCETIYGFADCIQPRVTGLGQSPLAPCPLPRGHTSLWHTVMYLSWMVSEQLFFFLLSVWFLAVLLAARAGPHQGGQTIFSISCCCYLVCDAKRLWYFHCRFDKPKAKSDTVTAHHGINKQLARPPRNTEIKVGLPSRKWTNKQTNKQINSLSGKCHTCVRPVLLLGGLSQLAALSLLPLARSVLWARTQPLDMAEVLARALCV